MAQLRMEKLLQNLSESEQQILDRKVAEYGREELTALLELARELGRNNEQLDEQKNKVFKAIYGKSYSQSKDYLYRNECRLLTNKIYEAIAEHTALQQMATNDIKFNLMLLQGLYDKKLWQEFESVAEKTLEKAISVHDFSSALVVNNLQVLLYGFNSQFTQDNAFKGREHLLQGMQLSKQHYQLSYWNQANKIAGFERILSTQQIAVSPTVFDVENFSNSYSALAEYQRLRALALQARGTESVALASQALAHICTIENPNDDIIRERIVAYTFHGTLCAIAQEYAPAKASLEVAIEEMRSHKIAPDAAVFFNYASVLMRLQQYDVVLSLLDEYNDVFSKDNRVRFRVEYFRCFAYIFSGKHAEAMQAIPKDISKRAEDEYHYFLFTIGIIFYLSGDVDSALREMQNFSKRFARSKKGITNAQDKFVCDAFRTFYFSTVSDSDKKKEKLRKETNEHIQKAVEAFPAYTDYFPLNWLRMQLR